MKEDEMMGYDGACKNHDDDDDDYDSNDERKCNRMRCDEACKDQIHFLFELKLSMNRSNQCNGASPLDTVVMIMMMLMMIMNDDDDDDDDEHHDEIL